MIIEIKKQIELKKMTEFQRKKIIINLDKYFSFYNPVKEKQIKLYKILKTKIKLEVGSMKKVLKLMNKLNINPKIINKREEGKDINITTDIEPRDEEQKKAINGYLNSKYTGGILRAICGFGKSFVAIKIIAEISKKTLIIVDEIIVMAQWVDYFTENTNLKREDIGVVYGSKKEYENDEKIIIAVNKTLYNNKEIVKKINKDTGLIVVDECHLSAAKTFTQILTKVKAKRMLGLSATPIRDDGLFPLVKAHIGEIYYTADIKKVVAAGSVIKPYLRPIMILKNNFYKEQHPDVSKRATSFLHIVENLMADDKVLDFITNIIKKHNEKGDIQICIIKRKKLIKRYYDALKEKVDEEDIAILQGTTTKKEKKEREKNIKLANEGKKKILLTTTVVDKAVSINPASILHNIYPSREMANTVQRDGRVARSHKGKSRAIVYDYIYHHPMFFSQFHSRKKKNRLVAHKYICEIPSYIQDFKNMLYEFYYYNDGKISSLKNLSKKYKSIQKYKKQLFYYIND